MAAILLLTFNALFFLVVSFIFIFLPGRLLVSSIRKNLSPLEDGYLSLILGVVVFIIQAIVFGILHQRGASIYFLGVMAIISLVKLHAPTGFFKDLLKNKVLLLILFVGILTQGAINFSSGWKFADGIDFWSSQGHDGLWHVSLMEEISQTFPPSMPLYAGRPLTNYHYISDIFMGEFYRIFNYFTALDLYFRFYPILFSFLIGLGVFVFVKRIKDQVSAYWAMFFTYFCGSFGYIVALINNQFPFTGETIFWASQGNTILGNPPHTLGIILLTSILLIISLWEKHKSNHLLFLLSLIGFSLAGVKVSSGAIFVLGILTIGAYSFIKDKKPTLLIASIIVAIGNFITLKIISPTAQSFIIFEPLWFPRTMMVVRLNNVDWELRRQFYASLHTFKGFVHLILHELEAILIFILGNTAMRVVGLYEIARMSLKKVSLVYLFMITGMTASIVIVLLFVQSGVTFNLIQFIQIYFHFFGIFAGISVATIISKIRPRPIKFLLAVVIISLSIPTAIGNLHDFYGPGKRPLARISNAELEGLNWLRNNTPKDAIIFTKPFDKNAHYRYKTQPLPISGWYPTMYVHSISGRQTFLSGEEQLSITGYKIDEDLKRMSDFMKQEDAISNKHFLDYSCIDYLYFRRDELDKPINDKALKLTTVFSNQEIIIYKND